MPRSQYEIQYFIENSFRRKRCPSCGGYFWTRNPDINMCGDAPCVPYSFIDSPVLEEKGVDDMREFFLAFFEKRDHARIKRYPVIARWRDDVFLTNASIYDFQPFVTSGVIPPPANPLTISQPCIRLDDLDSVGKSGRHLTTFEMMAHHAFNYPDREIYWKSLTVEYCDQLLEELGADLEQVTYKEKPWAGGGNAGPCLEVLLGGLELATLVFMDLEKNPKGSILIGDEAYQPMDMTIVDTGYGLERFVWASNGAPTIYDAVFPEVLGELMDLADIKHEIGDEQYASILAQNARLAGMMDVRGSANLYKLRKEVAKRMNVSVEDLQSTLEPVETVYAIADHTRCLAFMLGDGIIPSNVKAGYLARLVIRRTLRMMQSLDLDHPLSDIVSLQIKYLDMYPEFMEHLSTITEILNLEEERYDETLSRGERLVKRTAEQYKKKHKSMPLDELISLYDTHGIPPEIVREVATDIGVKVDLPDNFYSLVADSHSRMEQEEVHDPYAEKVKGLPETTRLFYDDPYADRFEAVVLDVIDGYVVLDQTLYYPEGGGQPTDEGIISTENQVINVTDVKNVNGIILHKIDEPNIKKGDIVEGRVNLERRMAHCRHHTATHLILYSAKRILGDHVWQSGAQKSEDRARLDVSHFKRITPSELQEIEALANSTLMNNMAVHTSWMDRSQAEDKYGFVLYQGGIPPGEKIRVVEVGGDVQACAGTHCKFTGDLGLIKILRSERIQDGVERLEFSAGMAAVEDMQESEMLLDSSANILRVSHDVLPSTVNRFFEEWKGLQKESSRLKEALAESLVKTLVEEAAEIKGMGIVVRKIPNADMEQLLKLASEMAARNTISILAAVRDDGARVTVSAPEEAVQKGINAGDIVRNICELLEGSGGGKPTLAQGGGPDVQWLDDALENGLSIVRDVLEGD